MGDVNLNPSPPAPKLVSLSADMIDDWSHLLPGPERSAFVEACTGAIAGARGDDIDGLFHPILGHYFSIWKTSLMGDDLNRLQMLATSTSTYVQIRDYVKVIWLEDDFDFEKSELGEAQPSESAIWPRHEDGQVAAEDKAFGVGLEVLKAMLAAQQLRPDRLEIKDKRTVSAPSDPEIAAILARNILDGADLAVTVFILDKESWQSTIIAAELSAVNQGQGIGFSILRKANLCLSQNLNPNSYWADQILLHAPALKELSLSFWQHLPMPHTPPFILDNKAWPALEKLEISSTDICTPTIMAILSKSEQSLTRISFRLMTLWGNNSTWAELLRRIGNEFPHLTWFKLTNLCEGPISRYPISFLDLEKDGVVSEPYKTRLKMLKKPNADGTKRIPRVEYEGPDASHVLRIVAECAVATQRS